MSGASAIRIDSVSAVIDALVNRLEFFVSMGCRASHRALEYPPFRLAPASEIEITFKKALAGEVITSNEADAYKKSALGPCPCLYKTGYRDAASPRRNPQHQRTHVQYSRSGHRL